VQRRYAELPVRHNEDELNGELAKLVPWEVGEATLDSPHTKAFLLLQCHFARIPLPIADYANDLASVLDQSLRVLNAMVDIAADAGLLHCCLQLMHLTQMVVQGRSLQASTLRQLPHCNSKAVVDYFARESIAYLPQLMALPSTKLRALLDQAPGLSQPGNNRRGGGGGGNGGNGGSKGGGNGSSAVNRVVQAVCGLPSIDVTWRLEDDNGFTVRGGTESSSATAAAANGAAGNNGGGKVEPKVARLNDAGECVARRLCCGCCCTAPARVWTPSLCLSVSLFARACDVVVCAQRMRAQA
jgi:hypothetical protein